ncbi:hypothetical protein [Tychonema sp. LEGE 06208]|nr:hypothetical protein [Tychonema sp. LEGE 06208]
MLSKLIRILPDYILNPIYDAIFAEFLRRGNIIFDYELTGNDRN